MRSILQTSTGNFTGNLTVTGSFSTVYPESFCVSVFGKSHSELVLIEYVNSHPGDVTIRGICNHWKGTYNDTD